MSRKICDSNSFIGINLKYKEYIYEIYFVIQYFEANSWYKPVAFVFVWLNRTSSAGCSMLLCMQSCRSTLSAYRRIIFQTTIATSCKKYQTISCEHLAILGSDN